MQPQAHYSGQQVQNGARQLLYQLFSLAASDPRSQRWSRWLDRDFQEAARQASEYLASDACALGIVLAPGEQPAEKLVTTRMQQLLGDAAKAMREHDRIFGLVMSKDCPPYESEYCPQTFSVSRAHHLADIAGFYNAFGVEPSDDQPERPDHLSLELEFMAWLIAKEQHALTTVGPDRAGPDRAEHVQVCREAQRRFFGEHLAWWVPAFTHALANKAGPDSFHAVFADSLAAFVAIERAFMHVPLPSTLCPEEERCDS